MKRRSLAPLVLVLGMLLGGGCSQEVPAPSGSARSAPGASEQEAELYTCSMHPEIVDHDPGSCPICGMELIPVRSSAGADAQSGTPESGFTGSDREIAYWVAPMDPTYVSDKPGKSPMGMELIPVYADGGSAGAIRIDPVVIQSMGVRIERAERQPLFRHIRAIGEIQVAEDRISVVNLRVTGWVERVYAGKTGEPVEAGQRLFDLYSPEIVAAQEEYLLAIRRQGPRSDLARSARRKLELWGLAKEDLDALAKSGKVERVIPVRAPRAGFILDKNIVEGAHVREGQDLYRIGDLSSVWVTAEVYEHDAPWVEVGQSAQMELTHQKDSAIEGTVAYVYPTLNPMSRTLTVRLEFENADYRFKPGMFATVYVQFGRKEDVLVVPTEAILHSGTREIVFVVVGEGRFEPREISTGLVGDRHRTEVLSGLSAGDLVVASGQFLIDSESQLQEAFRKMLERDGSSVQ